MEVDNDFIYVDLMDTAGEVNYRENFHNLQLSLNYPVLNQLWIEKK